MYSPYVTGKNTGRVSGDVYENVSEVLNTAADGFPMCQLQLEAWAFYGSATPRVRLRFVAFPKSKKSEK